VIKKLFNTKKASNLFGVMLIAAAVILTDNGSYFLFGEPKAPKSLIK
jgi:hypothetical protein